MDIYPLLSNKPHNSHYLNRYLKFIEACKLTEKSNQRIENHHILPSSSDLFPEYKSFKEFPWNKVKLTIRQHFIAHLLLSKTFGGKQIQAFFLMCNRTSNCSSKYYFEIRNHHVNMMKSDKNPMKNKETVDKFRHKRPEQSIVAIKRNEKYWKTNRKQRILKYSICLQYGEIFGKEYTISNIKSKLTCSQSCNGKRNMKKRPTTSVVEQVGTISESKD